MTPNELNLQQYMEILRARARFIVGVFVVAIAITGVITYLTPKMYTASTTLNFEFKGGNPFANTGGASVWSENTYIATQMDIIKSLNVAQKVEDSLTQKEKNHLIASLQAKNSEFDKSMRTIKGFIFSLVRNDTNRGHEGKASSEDHGSDTLQIRSPYNWLARSIGHDMTVQPMFGSRIVEISYASTNRQVATLMANKFAEAYITANLQMIVNPAHKTKLWFDGQLKFLRKNLQDTQSRLTAYQQKEGIIATDGRIDTENKRLQNLTSQLVAAQRETRNAVTEQLQLRDIFEGGMPLMTFPKVFNNSVIQKIKSELRSLEGEFIESSSRLGENHPKYKRVRLELNAKRDRLDAEIKAITGGIDNAAELAMERERDLAKTLEQQKQLVLDLKYEYDRISVLAREVESAQTTYNSALDQLNKTSMRSMVDQTNVSIVDPANVPKTHSSPRVMNNLVLGGLCGLLLGIGMTIFMEMLNRRVHSKEDLIAEMGVPLLGQLKKA